MRMSVKSFKRMTTSEQDMVKKLYKLFNKDAKHKKFYDNYKVKYFTSLYNHHEPIVELIFIDRHNSQKTYCLQIPGENLINHWLNFNNKDILTENIILTSVFNMLAIPS